MNVYIIIPIFNESLNLEFLANSLKTSLSDYNNVFVFVDDCSTDNSVALIHTLFNDTTYQVITKDKNQGPGDSFNIGFEWVLEHSQNPSDKIITMEGDNTSDLSILPDMMTISSLGYNLTLASIYVQGGGFCKVHYGRRFLSVCANLLFRHIFNIKVRTLSSFYRVYHVSLIRNIKNKYHQIISEKGFICMIEILLKAIQCDARIIEVPMILSSKNNKGKSKMKILNTTLNYLRFSLKARKWKNEFCE